MVLDIAGILKLFETGYLPEEEEEKVEEPLTSSISKIETENVAKKSQEMFQAADEVSKLPMPKTYGDMANIIRINSQLPREYKPTMGTIEYVGKAVYSKIFEKYLYGLGEGAAGALAAGAKAVGLKDVASYFEGSKEMWKAPPVTEEVDKQYAYLRDSATKKSALYGAAVEIAESGAQIGGLLIQMGLLGKVPALKAFDETVLSGTAPLGKVTKHMATMAVHGLATTPGDLSTRLQSALYRMAYNMTPYIANSTNAIGWGARSIDTSLNMFLTMPSYIAAAKSAKDPMDFIMKSIPQFMSDFIFALNTTGTPLNQRLSLMSKQQKFVNMTRAEKTGYLNLVDKAVAEKWEDTRVYGDEAPAPNKEQLMSDVKARAEAQKWTGKAYRGELPSQKEFKTAQEKLDYDAKMFGNTQIRVRLYDIAKRLGINLSKIPSKDIVWVTKEEWIAKRYGEAKEVKLPKDTIILMEDGEGGQLILKDSSKYMQAIKPVYKYSTPEWKVTDQKSLERLGNAIAKDVGMGGIKIKWDYSKSQWYDTEIGETIQGYAFGKTKEGGFPIRINIPRLYTEKTETPYMRDELIQTILHELGHIAEKTPAGTVHEMHPINYQDWLVKHEKDLYEKVTPTKPGAELRTKAADILIQRAEEAVTKVGAKVEAETKVGRKAALAQKISLLTEPILRGRKLPTDQEHIVLSEHKNVWGRLKDGMLIWAAGNDRPERMLEELDGYKRGRNVEELYVKPNQALDMELISHNKGVDDVRDTIKRLGLHDNLGEFYGQKKMVGNVLMSDNEAVDIYMSSQNKDGLRHLQKGVGLGDKDVAAVKTKVDGSFKLKALSDWLFTKYEEQYPRLAAAYLAETGKVLPKVPYYSPLRVFKESINFETENIAQEIFEKGQPKGYAYVEKGMTEARKVGAKNPVIMDALGNYLYNLGRVEHYIAFAVPAKEMRTIINNPQWKETVITQKGRAFYKNVQEYYGAVAGTRPGVAYDMADKTMNILRRHAGTAMLGFNVLTALRQPLSAFQAAGEIGVYHLLNGIKQVGLDPVGMEKFIYDRSPQTKFRMGQFERFMAEQARVGTVEEVIKGPKGLHKVRKVALSPVVFMDKYTVLAVWKGAYDRVYMTSKTLDGERILSADLERVAAMEADLAVRRTQPMATAKDLPGWHRSGTVASMFTMFQNQVNNNYNYFKHDIIGKVKSGQITPGTAAYRTMFTYLLPAMVLTMIANGRVKMSKEEAMKALIAYPLAGTFVLGGMINNIMQGYGTWGIPPLQGPIDLIAGAAAKKWTNKARLGLKGMAEITGIPYNQVYRTYMGMRALMNGETDEWRRLIWSEYALTKQQGDIEEFINMFRKE